MVRRGLGRVGKAVFKVLLVLVLQNAVKAILILRGRGASASTQNIPATPLLGMETLSPVLETAGPQSIPDEDNKAVISLGILFTLL